MKFILLAILTISTFKYSFAFANATLQAAEDAQAGMFQCEVNGLVKGSKYIFKSKNEEAWLTESLPGSTGYTYQLKNLILSFKHGKPVKSYESDLGNQKMNVTVKNGIISMDGKAVNREPCIQKRLFEEEDFYSKNCTPLSSDLPGDEKKFYVSFGPNLGFARLEYAFPSGARFSRPALNPAANTSPLNEMDSEFNKHFRDQTNKGTLKIVLNTKNNKVQITFLENTGHLHTFINGKACIATAF